MSPKVIPSIFSVSHFCEHFGNICPTSFQRPLHYMWVLNSRRTLTQFFTFSSILIGEDVVIFSPVSGYASYVPIVWFYWTYSANICPASFQQSLYYMWMLNWLGNSDPVFHTSCSQCINLMIMMITIMLSSLQLWPAIYRP